MLRLVRPLSLGVIGLASLFAVDLADAYPAGYVGSCTGCHGGGPAGISSRLVRHTDGATSGITVAAGHTVALRAALYLAGLQWGGFSVQPSVTSGTFSAYNATEASYETISGGSSITHSKPRYDGYDFDYNYNGTLNGWVNWIFNWTAPANYTGWVTFTAWENAVNHNGLCSVSDGDKAASTTLSVYVSCPDNDGDGYTQTWCGGNDCNDGNYSIHPGRAETCGDYGTDNNCNGNAYDVNSPYALGAACTTGKPGVCSPGSYQCTGATESCAQTVAQGTETCANIGTDNDCDGDANEIADGVHAGDACSTGLQGVCSAGTRVCSGGAAICQQTTASSGELCDGKDNDCNGQIDDNLSALTCGVGACQRVASACVNGVPQGCTPGQPTTETCNLIDDDCNGAVDDMGTTTCGVGACANSVAKCAAGVLQTCTPLPAGTETCANVGTDDDCDGDATELTDGVHAGDSCTTSLPGVCTAGGRACDNGALSCSPLTPPSAETCNSRDDDCNGQVDDGVPLATCGLGECKRTGTTCDASSCTAGTPGVELCDGKDNDCNGLVDDELPPSKCGIGACAATGSSCLPSTCQPGQPSTEICDNIDNNCDGKVDEGCDDDGDGYCDSSMTKAGAMVIPACPKTPEAATEGDDCDDTSAKTHPGATELCDGKDNDCNGQVDDNVANPTCGEGECTRPATGCVNGVPQDCTPGTPTAETCDGKDNDCNDLIDDLPAVACGTGICAVSAPACVNGVAQDCSQVVLGEPSPEACDGVDNDCNGSVDDGNLCGAGMVCENGACTTPDAGTDAGDVDASVDASLDASADASADAGKDAAADGTKEVGADGAAGSGGGDAKDASLDVEAEAATVTPGGADAGSSDEGGCGCRTARAGGPAWGSFAGLGLALALGLRRRSKRRARG